MSRLRKGGKYKGGEFASDFKFGLSTKTPFAFVPGARKIADMQEKVMEAAKKAKENKAGSVAVAGSKDAMTESALQKARQGPSDAAAKAAVDNRGKEDIVPSDTDYSREEVDSYFQRRKLASEKDELEKLKQEQEAAAAKAKEDADKEANTITDSDGNVQYTNEYDPSMSKADRKAEKKSNKAEIKDNFRAAKDECKGKRGKAKRQCKRSARRDKRSAKKSNRQSNRSTRKASKGK
tara:strand:+ start:373 stop:1080 length:708 start_codon:yes stop_codon:yes gene_type:complete